MEYFTVTNLIHLTLIIGQFFVAKYQISVLNKKSENVDKEIKSLETRIFALEADHQNLKLQLDTINKSLEKQEDKLNEINKSIHNINLILAKMEGKTEGKLEAYKKVYEAND